MSQIPATAIVDGTLYTLTAFSVATWTIILFKSVQIWRSGRQNRTFHTSFWDTPDLETAERLSADPEAGPKARIARAGFLWLKELRSDTTGRLKYRGTPEELLERALQRQLRKEQHAMERGLTPLASMGSTAPFVGLFGTVVGIMHALHEVSKAGTATLDVVAGPIGEALIATAIGIAVAVPAVLAYNFFLRRAKLQRLGLESFGRDFLHLVLNPDTANGGR
ncbi:biopolymer transport protein ExbB [Methylomagnum ishizawai]|uniref:Biopolymer transport protein ExbB n=1 Tax=Methylomagnum ishizawai TaxID=1760988 RepID=A0A1Y6D2Z3_9GAMM|nr:MotA/TolQ/ExbB proton channel family protein [Methylomagnum ishizawai]SMF95223.1 biopolymer transport protein ExbB [Methylomagnum ishizawai]